MATDKKKFGIRTYHAHSETVAEKPSYCKAWKESRFDIVLVQSFYEPNWETRKVVRWKIKIADNQPLAIASIWGKFTKHGTGGIIFFILDVTINAA